VKDFWNSLTVEQQVELIKQVVPTLSIVIGAIISIIIFLMTKQKEIKFKIHEQRKIKYDEYLTLFKKTLVNPEIIEKGNLPFNREKWIAMQFGLIIYGSDKVLNKITELNNIARTNQEKNNELIIVKFGELIHIMREEVGLTNKNISIRDSLSLFITDINDEKYDHLFSK